MFLVLVAAGCPAPVPEPDSCLEPQAPAGLEQLELGEGELDSLFVPWVDGQEVPLVVGTQGGTMFGSRLRLIGDDLPECFAQATYVSRVGGDGEADAGPDLPLVDVALHSYAQDDGSRLTRTLFLIYPAQSGDELTVETTVGDISVTRTITLVDP